MTIDDLLNQKPKLALPGGPRSIDSVDIALCLKDYVEDDIGVKTQEEKDILEGYLLMLGKKNRVYLSEDYMYG